MEQQEVRIALAMNGGVSLAVWIGGVTREFARLLAQAGKPGKRNPAAPPNLTPPMAGPYAELCAILGVVPVIDVIAGASAGGVNGAYLALALSRHGGAALDRVAANLRDIWITDGDIEALLRSPLASEAPSVLDGDGFYYGKLRDAFADLKGMKGLTDCNIDATLTATLFTGEPQYITDDFGASIPDLTHRAHFRFRTDARKADGSRCNAFDDAAIDSMLAVAARSTSSFPGAFEPSFCPIWDGDPAKQPVYHSSGRPFMNGVACSPQGPLTKSRLLMDGGVLDNKPIDFALQAIFEQPAKGPARRVLAYVNPNPGDSTEPAADAPRPVPGLLSSAISALVGIPQVQSISNQIDGLRAHNAAVARKRRSRALITYHLQNGVIDDMSEALFSTYQDVRIEQALAEIVDGLNHALSRHPNASGFGRSGRGAWLRNQAFNLLQEDAARDKAQQEVALPWVPRLAPLKGCGDEEQSAGAWKWGTRSVQQLSRIAFDLLVRAQKASIKEPLKDFWERIGGLLAEADRIRHEDANYWRDSDRADKNSPRGQLFDALSEPKARPLGPADAAQFRLSMQGWRQESIAPAGEQTITQASEERTSPAGKLAHAIAEFVRDLSKFCLKSELGLIPPDRAQRSKLKGLPPDEANAKVAEEDLYYLVSYFVREPEDSQALVLSRLLALLVVTQALGDYGSDSTAEEIVEFIQVSGDDDELLRDTGSIMPGDRKASDKLTGIQLSDFGAFYKGSWRANDWLWGRRDAVSRILHILLSPQRLREVAIGSVAQLVEAIGTLVKKMDGGTPGYFTQLWTNHQPIIQDEFVALVAPGAPLPETLPNLTALLTRCLHIQILTEEMPFLARQIALDQQDGMYTSRAARDIGMDIDTLSPFWLSKLNLRGKPIPLDTVPPALAEKYLDKPLLGGSQWQSEVGTDQATVVVARMLAVGVTTINATGTIGALLGKVRTALRLPTLLFYLLARNLKTGSRTAAYLNSAVFIGALVVVGTRLYYYDTKPPLYNPTIVSFAVAVLIAMTLVLVMIGRPWLQWAAAIGLTITIGLALVRGHAALNWAIELLNNPEPWHKAALYEGAVLAVIGAGWLMPRPKWLWHEYAVPWFDQTWRNFDARMNLLFGGLIRLRARER